MKYSSEDLQLYRILERAVLPYIAIPLSICFVWFILATTLAFIDIFFATSFASRIEILFLNYNLASYAFIFLCFYIFINSKIIFVSKDFGRLFTKQKYALQESIEKIEDITTIQEKMHEIWKTIKKILILRKVLSWITTKKSFIEINNYFKTEIGVFLSSMINLRSDLLTRIEEQKQTLTWAKADVEDHISGTTALEQVSELQRARLDEQIHQFEELQRVLVKI